MSVTTLNDFVAKWQNSFSLSNHEKASNAPLAAILIGATDTKNALTGLYSDLHFKMLQNSSFHVEIISVGKGKEVEPKLLETVQKIGKLAQSIFFHVHGSENDMEFGDGEEGLFTAKDLTDKFAAALAPNAVLNFVSCQTGCSLAQDVAAKVNRRIIAPLASLAESELQYRPCAKHGWEFTSEKVKLAIWQGTKLALSCPLLSSGKEEEDYTSCLDGAQRKDPKAQFLLSKFFAQGSGAIFDPNQAKKFLRKAAKQGWPEAQFELGKKHFEIGLNHIFLDTEDERTSQEKHYIKARDWLSKANKSGHLEAEKMLGKVKKLLAPLKTERTPTSIEDEGDMRVKKRPKISIF